jgi:hypothetical protein
MPFRAARRRERREPQVLSCDGDGSVHVRDVGGRLAGARDRAMASSWPTSR